MKINNQNAVPVTTAVESVKNVTPVNKQHENKFSEMIDKKDKQSLAGNKKGNTISPEELRKEITNSMMQQSVKRTMDKAREISNDMKK